MTTENRSEELMRKGFGKLTDSEKLELNNLMAQNLQESQSQRVSKVIEQIKNIIQENGIQVNDVVKALSGNSEDGAYFLVPYKDSKDKPQKYIWFPGKKAVGKSAEYFKKLKEADEEKREEWATAKGKEWLKTPAGKAFFK